MGHTSPPESLGNAHRPAGPRQADTQRWQFVGGTEPDQQVQSGRTGSAYQVDERRLGDLTIGRSGLGQQERAVTELMPEIAVLDGFPVRRGDQLSPGDRLN